MVIKNSSHRWRQAVLVTVRRAVGQVVLLCIVALVANVLICRVAYLDWRLDRVYFLAFLNLITGTTGASPYRQVGQSLSQ